LKVRQVLFPLFVLFVLLSSQISAAYALFFALAALWGRLGGGFRGFAALWRIR
jgi:hypothetical protein